MRISGTSTDQVLLPNRTYFVATTGSAWHEVDTTSSIYLEKTGTYSAFAGDNLFIDTSGGAVEIDLPTSPSQGDTVSFIDAEGTFDTNNLTIGRNSENIQGSAADLTVSVERAANTLVYTDGTQGWLLKNK